MKTNDRTCIPIVFAVDDGYAMPTAVAITSLIKNKKSNSLYHCYLLTPGLSEDNYKKLKSLETFDCRIEIIRSDAVSKYGANLKKVTNTDYFRLILDSYINEDKIIALDGDLLVLDDLTELYNIDLENNLIGGCYFRPHDVYNRKYVQERLGLDEGKRINIGVMLMDLDKIRKENLQKKFIENIGKFEVMSEDIINYVCKDRIKYIPLKYNYNLHFYKYKKLLKNCPVYSQKEYREAQKKPTIFHYTLSKPWKDKNVEKRKLWLSYFKETPYKNTDLQIKKQLKVNILGLKFTHTFK